MAVAGTGTFGKAMDNMRTLLSNCDAFQTWTGTEDAAGALAHVYLWGELDENISASDYPMAAVYFGPSNNYGGDREAGGESNLFLVTGSFDVVFWGDVSADYQGDDAGKWADAFMEAVNAVGGIVDDVRELSGTDNGTNAYLNVVGFNMVNSPLRGDKASDIENRTEIWVRFEWVGI